jgi:hypothetical protein
MYLSEAHMGIESREKKIADGSEKQTLFFQQRYPAGPLL